MSLLKWFFEATIQLGSKSIALREVVGGVLGLTSAILGARRRVLAWPIGILGDALLFTVFLGAIFSFGDKSQHANFYGQASRNLLLILVSIYGWVRWSRHTRMQSSVTPPVTPRWTTPKEKLFLLPSVLLFFIISMQIFKALGESGQWLFVDT
jgi:nicotinamide mononucleotide transporter